MRRQIALQLLRSLGAPAAAEPAWVQASNAALRAPTTLLARRGYADDADLKKTPLYDTMAELFAAQEQLGRDLKARSRRLPALEEVAAFSENWLTARGGAAK